MSTPKAKTYMERLCFADGDILFWLERRLRERTSETLCISTEWQLRTKTSQTLPPKPFTDYENMTIRWEWPVSAHNGFIVGFLDMYVTGVRVPVLDTSWGVDRLQVKWDNAAYAFEAKTSIPNLGHLFRQLAFYGNETHGIPITVVSPDDRFADQIRSQGYRFLKFEAP